MNCILCLKDNIHEITFLNKFEMIYYEVISNCVHVVVLGDNTIISFLLLLFKFILLILLLSMSTN